MVFYKFDTHFLFKKTLFKSFESMAFWQKGVPF